MVDVRKAVMKDANLLMELINEMGRQERLQVFAHEEKLVAAGFGPTPKFQAIIAEVNGSTAGYALFFDYYSSFNGDGIFLEDLFVREEFRGKSVGRALLSYIARMAIDRGSFGIIFNVLDWNKPALRFFKAAGATVLHQRKTLCLTTAALQETDSRAATSIQSCCEENNGAN